MNEQIDQARKAGYSESEITNYLVQKYPEYADQFKKAKEAGYSDNEVLNYFQNKMSAASKQQPPQEVAQQQPPVPQEDALQSVNRNIAQVPQALAEATPAGLTASGLQLFGTGEALAGYYELEERLPELKKKFPHLPWPETIDKEKYMEAVRDASESFPTVANIGRMIEEKTGLPLEPKSDLDKGIRFIANMTKFKSGTFPEKINAGLKAEVMKEALEHAGLPEPAAEAGGLYFGLHTKTPEGFKLPKEKAIGKVAPEVPPPGGGEPPPSAGSTTPPPEPPPPTGIAPGSTLPRTEGTFQTKEQAIEALKIPETIAPAEPELSATERFFRRENRPTQARPLTSREDLFRPRVTAGGRDMGMRPAPVPTGRSTTIPVEDEIGNIFSRNQFYNTTQGGHAVADELRQQSDALYQQLNEAYTVSRQMNRFVDEIQPQLVSEFQEFAEPIRRIARRARSGPQRVVLGAIDDLLGQMVVETDGAINNYLPINNQVLIDTMQSLRQKVDHDFMHGDASNIFRPPINAISEALERAAQSNPEAIEALRNARMLRREWGEVFDNDYVRPLRNPNNRAYSKNFKGFLDLDEFNNLRPALLRSPRGQILERGIARDLVKKRIDPLIESDGMINPRALNNELRELRSFITPEEAREIEDIVRVRQAPTPTRSTLAPRTSIPKEKPPAPVPKPSPPSAFKKPEDIDKAFRTRTGIRELHKDLKKAGREDLFKKISEDKAVEIFKEGKYGEKKLTGTSIVETIDKNHEVLKEILGEEQLNFLYKEAEVLAGKEANQEWALSIGKKIAKRVLPYNIITKILKVFI